MPAIRFALPHVVQQVAVCRRAGLQHRHDAVTAPAPPLPNTSYPDPCAHGRQGSCNRGAQAGQGVRAAQTWAQPCSGAILCGHVIVVCPGSCTPEMLQGLGCFSSQVFSIASCDADEMEKLCT